MNIKELKAKQGNVDMTVDVVDIGPVRQFEKFGKAGRVATAIAKDESGDIKLSLWNEDIDKIKAGDKVHVINGYVSEWQGELQLTGGRMGKIEVVGKADLKKEEPKTPVYSNAAKDDSGEDINVEEEDIGDIDEEEI